MRNEKPIFDSISNGCTDRVSYSLCTSYKPIQAPRNRSADERDAVFLFFLLLGCREEVYPMNVAQNLIKI